MSSETEVYYKKLRDLTNEIVPTDASGKVLTLELGFSKAIGLIVNSHRRNGKLIFIGNGASAAISSHMATDFWKNGGIKSTAFNDASLLTCISNDFGYDQVFEKPIAMFANPEDILVAISSSGKSQNIIKGVQMALLKGCKVITLSGFNKDNSLRSLGNVNFYVPSFSYGQVEVMHHSICHCMLDTIISSVK